MKKRIYGKWAGEPKGTPENITRCVTSVYRSWGFISGQCSRKRGFGPDGLYCKQHAALAERREKRDSI
jgi:hypothetical protein